MKYYTYWPIRLVLHFFDIKVSVIPIWLVNAKRLVCGCFSNAAGTQPFIFKFGWSRRRSSLCQTADTKSCMPKQCFTFNRTVELWSKSVSKLVLTESIGGSKNSPDEHVCETTEAWHGLACTVLLCSAFACVFGLIFRFSCHSICRLQYKKVSMCYGWQTLGWESLNMKFRMSHHGGSEANGL